MCSESKEMRRNPHGTGLQKWELFFIILKERVADYSDINCTSKWRPFKFVGLLDLEESLQSCYYINDILCHKTSTFLRKTGFKPGSAVRAGEEPGVRLGGLALSLPYRALQQVSLVHLPLFKNQEVTTKYPPQLQNSAVLFGEFCHM